MEVGPKIEEKVFKEIAKDDKARVSTLDRFKKIFKFIILL